MGDLKERVDSVRVEVCTPNEQVFGVFHGLNEVTVTVAPGYAERVGDQETEAQLVKLAKLLFVERVRTYDRIKSDELGSDPFVERNRALPPYQDELDALEVSGRSSDGMVTITEIGLQHWSVALERGSADSAGSEAIGRAMTEAGNNLLANLRVALREVHARNHRRH